MDMKIATNFEGLAGIIGKFRGMAEAADDTSFIQELLVSANDRTLQRFNIAAAAFNSGNQRNLNRRFPHMYEYGTAGITQGRGGVRFADPTSQASRLWVFNTVPAGNTVETFVTFRDAVAPNLKPMERTDLEGLPLETVQAMSTRKYVFKERARLVEYGAIVSITPKYAQALIYPTKDNERGYGFWTKQMGPMQQRLESVTGNNSASRHKGAFTSFFLKWWNTTGEQAVIDSAHNSFRARIGAATRYGTVNKTLKPVQTTNVIGASEAAAKIAEEEMKRKSYKYE